MLQKRNYGPLRMGAAVNCTAFERLALGIITGLELSESGKAEDQLRC